MKMEELGLERIEEEYKLKNEQVVKEHEEYLHLEQLTKQKNGEEADLALKKLQHS
jgi:hypothetical protein